MVPEIFAFLGTDTARPDFEITTFKSNCLQTAKTTKIINLILFFSTSSKLKTWI
eukprot:UN22052